MKQTQAGSATKPLTSREANFALAIFLLAYILSFVDRQILSLMVDPIRQDLNLSDIQIGLLQGFAFAILYATLGVPFGMWADRGSRRNIIVFGVLFWSFATAMCGMATSYAFLFLARICVGVGEATLSPAAHSFLTDAFAKARLARAMAIYTLGITIGGGMALIIGGSVVQFISQTESISIPVLGELRAWQAAFLVVSLPGILVALLAVATREPPRSRESGDVWQGASLAEVFRYIAANRRAFLGIHASSALLAVFGYGMVGWYPTLLIRSFGLSVGEAGAYLGAVYLVLGSIGSLTGGLLAERMALKGRSDANLRMVMLLGFGVVVPATLAPIMPNLWLMLTFFSIACLLFNGYFCCSVAAVQLASPPSMRGANAALFLLSNSLFGLSIGMLAVPLVDKLLFGGSGQLGPALATIAVIVCTGAALFAKSGLSEYGRIVDRRAPQPNTLAV